MGEEPIYTCQAHVFTIDPKTKKTWLPASNQAIKVSFFFDKSREQYRILSNDETAQDLSRKMPINSIMTEKMSFKKTSQKFGQWADTASNAVYGLGFSNESDLDRFVEQFCQALDHTRRLRKQPQPPMHFAATEYEQPNQPQQPQQQPWQQQPQPQLLHHQLPVAGDIGGAVDLDYPGESAAVWRGQVDRLTSQLQQTSLSLQKVERENQALRASGSRASEADTRVAQLEKENSMLKSRVKSLEDSVSQLEQQLKEVPLLAGEVQRRLHEASAFAGQLAKLAGSGGGAGPKY